MSVPSSEKALKLLLIGDSAVGKTCMLLRFSEDTYDTEMVSTIGVDFKTKVIQLDGESVKLQVWDTAGQERFRNITQAYYRGASGIIIVYDITNEQSYRHVKGWMDNIKKRAEPSVSVLLVGNKSDSSKRVISYERGEETAERYNTKFIETSAKNDVNINKAFLMIAKEAKRNNSNGGKQGQSNRQNKTTTVRVEEQKNPIDDDHCC